jgi:transcriptional regulator with XRE-family HTH domain
MERSFSQTMSELRRARGLSQRSAAADLKISQALLSHYENGAREPGLGFVRRACKYYGVSADYLLGLTDSSGESRGNGELGALLGELRSLTEKVEHALEGLER